MKQNLVLIGMSGCGKSTVGRLTAEKLGLLFADTDSIVANTAKMSIKEIFAQKGEEAFRRLERQAVMYAAGLRGAVIATGGGVPEEQANIEALRKNGIILLLLRPVDVIAETVDKNTRPLFTNSEAVRALWQRRKEIYGKCADITVQNTASPEECAANIAALWQQMRAQ